MTRLAAIVLVLFALTGCGREETQAPVPAAEDGTAVEMTEETTGETTVEEAAPTQPMVDETIPEETMVDEEVVLDEDVAPVVAKPQIPKALERYQEGRHYTTLPVAQPTRAGPGQVEVAEVFWYGCPHCYTLEPFIQEWRLNGMPDDTIFVQIPAALNANWQVHARVFYTAEALGILEEVHPAIFREIHVNRNMLDTRERLIEFFARFDVSEQDFLAAWDSFAVQTNLRRADAQVRRFRLSGVPAVVVNGKYVTGADLAGGNQQLLDVINFLVAKEKRGG
ncbi:MAG: thiol:disulfide interchange protein DsbA/DsbL [Gammaproteobacteria bacterium]